MVTVISPTAGRNARAGSSEDRGRERPPLVSAIVLNYRTPQDAVRCVRALLRQTIVTQACHPEPVEGRHADVMVRQAHHDTLEILLVDNHSQDDSIGVLRNTFRNDPRVRILEARKNQGYGGGNALGAGLARGQYILIINPDNELDPDGLEKMVGAMEADPSIGILGPRLVHEDGTVRDSYRTFPTLTDLLIKRTVLRELFRERMDRYLQHGVDPGLVRDVDWLAGACLLLRRDLYERLGGFDPRFFLFFEDTDLCRRAWQAGKRVTYFPQARATDRKHRLSEGGFWSFFTKRTVRIHLLSAMKYFWKWRRGVPG